MDRRTLIFVMLSVMVFLLWSVIQRTDVGPTEPPEMGAQEARTPAPTEQLADTPSALAAPLPGVQADDAPALAKYRALADAVRDSAVTLLSSPTSEIEIAHRTASLRSWRLPHYPMREPSGRLGKRTMDLISVYAPDYLGTRLRGELLDWTPVGTPPERIVLNGTGDGANIAFRAQTGDVEMIKTFIVRSDSHEWRGYTLDVELSVRNLGVRPTDALTYELRWGPGVSGDREGFEPNYGPIGGTLTRTELPRFKRFRDHDAGTPGTQGKDGEMVDVEAHRTIWAAIDSKYFVAALLTSDLEQVRGTERQAIFSEYDALDLPWEPGRATQREIGRLGLLGDVGKPWMVDDQHLWQEKTRRMLGILPTGTMSVNDDILGSTANVKDGEKGQAKLQDKLEGVYAEYTTVMGLLSGTRLEISGFYLDPGQRVTDRFRLFAGPKHTGMLDDVLLPDDETPAHLNETIELGFFGPVAKALMWLLKVSHSVLRNYGAAIILLTIIVRLVLYPLSQHSSESMKRMQMRMKIIQPFIDEVRSKFRDDAQRMNSETMKVYRKYGVNPAGQLGGCVVMIAQMPIFIAMFQMLRNAAELRGEPFILWITDLTAPDLLFSLGGFPVRVLPLFMTGGTILQQMMNPASGTMGGSQRTMMYMMPLIFLFMLYNMASGLNLYWGISTLLGVGQQFLVNKYGKSTGEENLTAADLERRAGQERKKKRRRMPSIRP